MSAKLSDKIQQQRTVAIPKPPRASLTALLSRRGIQKYNHEANCQDLERRKVPGGRGAVQYGFRSQGYRCKSDDAFLARVLRNDGSCMLGIHAIVWLF